MGFEIYGFTYYDTETNQGFVIYVRAEETAKQIIDIVNDENDIYLFTKKRFNDIYLFTKKRFNRFKRKLTSLIPPFEHEAEQFNLVEAQRKRRIEYSKTHQDVLNKFDK